MRVFKKKRENKIAQYIDQIRMMGILKIKKQPKKMLQNTAISKNSRNINFIIG